MPPRLQGVLEGGNRNRTLRQDLTIDLQTTGCLASTKRWRSRRTGRSRRKPPLLSPTHSTTAGALTGDGLRTFQYDESRRLVKVKILKSGETAFVSYLHNAMGHRVFKSEPEFEQSEPREDVLGNEFVDWLRTNFGWLFGTARAKNGMGRRSFTRMDRCRPGRCWASTTPAARLPPGRSNTSGYRPGAETPSWWGCSGLASQPQPPLVCPRP